MAVRFIGRFGPKGKLKISVLSPPIPVEPGNNPPAWITEQGLLGIYDELAEITINLDVADPDDDIKFYAISAGSLPPGLNLNTVSGVISGTISSVEQNTQYDFSVRVEDEHGNYDVADFYILVRDTGTHVVWQTPEDLGDSNAGMNYTNKLEAESQ